MLNPPALPFANKQKCAISFRQSRTADIIYLANISSGTGLSCKCVQDVNSVIIKPSSLQEWFLSFWAALYVNGRYHRLCSFTPFFFPSPFFPRHPPPTPPSSLGLSQLSDKRCLLAINPGGVLTGVPIKRSIFSLFGGFVGGPEEVR